MIEELFTKIEKLEPHPTEAITLIFNSDKIDINTVSNAVEHLGKKFPDNAIIALPDLVSLESWSKDVLENYISMISEVIETL